MTGVDLENLIDGFNTDKDFKISKAFTDCGIDPLFPSLKRAALNQINQEQATVNSYTIWANTVRDNIRKADEEIKADNHAEAHRLLCRTANSVSAFSEVQKALGKVCTD